MVVCCRNFPVVIDLTNWPASLAACPHSLGPGGLISTLAYFQAVDNLGLANSNAPASTANNTQLGDNAEAVCNQGVIFHLGT